MTTPPIMSVTDEMLAEIEEELAYAAELNCNAAVSPTHLEVLLSERAEFKRQIAKLEAMAKDVKWRVSDTADQLQAYGHNGDRLYGLDEWSVPIRNLAMAVGAIDTAMNP